MGFDIGTICRQLPKMIRDPNDTLAAMSFYKAVGGQAISDEMVAHLKSIEEGQRLLRERKEIFPVLTNREKLRALPPDTLGYQYISWADKEGLYPEGLVSMGEELGVLSNSADDTISFLEQRQQGLHDLYHLLTGYDRDPAGEIALLRFSAIQEKNRAMNIISWLGQIIFVLRGRFDLFKLRKDASVRALRSPLLMLQDWEELLELPIDDVRKQLKLYPVPQYKPLI